MTHAFLETENGIAWQEPALSLKQVFGISSFEKSVTGFHKKGKYKTFFTKNQKMQFTANIH